MGRRAVKCNKIKMRVLIRREDVELKEKEMNCYAGCEWG